MRQLSNNEIEMVTGGNRKAEAEKLLKLLTGKDFDCQPTGGPNGEHNCTPK